MTRSSFGALLMAGVFGLSAASPAMAVEPEENDFVYVSDLLDRGFTPFGTSGVNNALFGMTDGSEIYLCLSVDSRSARSPRRETLDAEMAGEEPDHLVPNIAIACVLTQ